MAFAFRLALSASLFSFGIQKEGRVLIADEMGLGKSIQALGVSLYYQKEWPLLIVCPASVKPAWKLVSKLSQIGFGSKYLSSSFCI